MASAPQSILATLQVSDYMSVMIATAVVYDYILTFPAEVEHIWKRPWTSMSVMFFVLRYVGVPVAIIGAFYGSPMISGTVTVCLPLLGTLAATDEILGGKNARCVSMTSDARLSHDDYSDASLVVMILRVYAMYNRSRLVLWGLLALYIPSVILFFVFDGIYYNPQTVLQVADVEIVDVSFCNAPSNIGPDLALYLSIPRLMLSVLLCVLAGVQFIRNSLEMHAALGKWRSKRYMNLLVRESILYFLVNLITNVVELIPGNLPEVAEDLLGSFTETIPFVLGPRLILGVREFHSHVVGEHIDSGFGLRSQRLSVHADDIMFVSPGERLID
ncbi:hypothetical protein HYDPIDRAFT_28171 [Hydnomerulius pinastri MD-312]|uniref:DUF6533 domain-containing protein n=1 Tax=Hydnomerulius pinastri MD-312 TaxID=994086 RepID=A0A0C9VGU3_9AGAM|nr:hypothetical protein HYDPIDRAFT_28171 [Hydnomerulius pinastri MD-312]